MRITASFLTSVVLATACTGSSTGTALTPTTAPSPAPSEAAPADAATASPVPTPVVRSAAQAQSAGCVEEGGELRVQSGGATLRGSLDRPRGGGPAPAVVLLHTKGGLSLYERTEAQYYAGQGFVAFAPDYFAPIAVTPQTFDVRTFAATYTNAVIEHLDRAVACLGSLPGVDRSRIGAVGYSMGGYLALVLATRPGIVAAAGWYAAYRGAPANPNLAGQQDWATVAAAMRAPVLLLHGDADTEVRIEVARRAEATLEASGKRSELVVYPAVGHAWNQLGSPRYDYDATATADARSRTLALLRR